MSIEGQAISEIEAVRRMSLPAGWSRYERLNEGPKRAIALLWKFRQGSRPHLVDDNPLIPQMGDMMSWAKIRVAYDGAYYNGDELFVLKDRTGPKGVLFTFEWMVEDYTPEPIEEQIRVEEKTPVEVKTTKKPDVPVEDTQKFFAWRVGGADDQKAVTDDDFYAAVNAWKELQEELPGVFELEEHENLFRVIFWNFRKYQEARRKGARMGPDRSVHYPPQDPTTFASYRAPFEEDMEEASK